MSASKSKRKSTKEHEEVTDLKHYIPSADALVALHWLTEEARMDNIPGWSEMLRQLESFLEDELNAGIRYRGYQCMADTFKFVATWPESVASHGADKKQPE